MSANDHNDRDQDPVWNLVDQSPPTKAGPLFARNVMREIRLGEQVTAPWWKRLLGPVPLTAGALAAAAAFAVIAMVDRPDGTVAQGPDSPVIEEFDLNQSLLVAAAEEPSLFSDAELLALLY